MEATPGQVLLLSVYGLKTEIPTPILTTPQASGWPVQVHSIQVDLVQGDPEVVIPTRA